MKSFLIFLFLVLGLLLGRSNLLGQTNLKSEEQTLLKVVTAIHFTFKQYAKEIWPEYDLSNQPYIAYMPDNFVLYLNARHAPPGFVPYPQDWPATGARAFVHFGVYQNLVGQFALNFKIDSVTTFAMGLPKNLLFSFDDPEYMLLSSTIHEGFHQFQQQHFGEIPWAREEQYPILDVQNTALASLELHILREALKAMFNGDDERLKTMARQFVAVREFRWSHADPFVGHYEQGQEINEGTARYVEMKAMACFFKLDTAKIQNRLLKAIKKDLADKTIQDLLLDDFNARLKGLAVAPDDMLRNRIYPVGAALGFLLDYLGLSWKTQFQAAGSGVTFAGFIKDYFQLDSTQLAFFFARAQQEFDYAQIRIAAQKLIQSYRAEYQQALNKFNSQKGIRVEIRLSNNSIQRFRSTRDKKWVVDRGKKLLCLHYNLYSLKSFQTNDLLLEVHDSAIFDQNDWTSRRKTVAFFVDGILQITVDGKRVNVLEALEKPFKQIEIIGDRFKFVTSKKGKVQLGKDEIIIILN